MNISDQEKKILQKKHKDFATWKAFTILEGCNSYFLSMMKQVQVQLIGK